MRQLLLSAVILLTSGFTFAQTGGVMTWDVVGTWENLTWSIQVLTWEVIEVMSGADMVEENGENAEEIFTDGDVVFADDSGLDDVSMQILNLPTPDWYGRILPLKHTKVRTHVSWFTSRTAVTHHFSNTYKVPLEVLYMFPLSSNAAVDYMEITIWNRTIIGTIKESEAARQAYEQAKSEWRIATLLTQQRDNIFTQQVANIVPNEDIYVTISYFEELKYDSGIYSYTFPMVVWPRFVGDNTITDAKDITSPTLPTGYKANEIDLIVRLEAGIEITDLESETHEIAINNLSETNKEVEFAGNEIPNKDFQFSYSLVSDEPAIGTIYHKSEEEDHGYVAMMFEPQTEVSEEQIIDKEIVFVLDTSWSMKWRPIEGVKQVMEFAIPKLNKGDAFNVYDFDDDVSLLFENPVSATDENIDTSLEFVKDLIAEWWTQIDNAFRKALDESNGEEEQRIILILTDGDVGNEDEILELVAEKLENNKIFVFGVDAAPNRFLLNKIAELGKGKAMYIQGEETMEEKVEEFYNSFASPVLTDIKIDWGNIDVTDVYPSVIPDLYAWEPIQVLGKYAWVGNSSIHITWKQWDKDFSEIFSVSFPDEKENSAIRSLRAKKKIDDINKQKYFWEISQDEQKEKVTEVWLEYSLLTEYTSFIAIDDAIVNTWELLEIENPNYQVDGKGMWVTEDLSSILSNLYGWSNTATTTTTTANSTAWSTNKVINKKISTSWAPQGAIVLPKFLPQTGASLEEL